MQLARNADHIIGPILLRMQTRNRLHAAFERAPLVLRKNAQHMVRSRRASDVAHQIDGNRQNKTFVVISMLADQVYAARRTEDSHAPRFREVSPKLAP